MRRVTQLLVIMSLMSVVVNAGMFRITRIWYGEAPLGDKKWTVTVNSTATYQGPVNSNDDDYGMETELWSEGTMINHGPGVNVVNTPPPYTGYSFDCSGGCGGSGTLLRPKCASGATPTYQGWAVVAITHGAGSPEIDPEWGSEELIQCWDPLGGCV